MKKKVFIFTVLSLASLGWLTTRVWGQQSSSFASSIGAVTSEVKFECENDKSFMASFSTEEAVVNLPEEQKLILPHVPAGSGAKYSNGNVTLWTKGRQAFVEVDGEIILDKCLAANTTDSNLNSSHTPKAYINFAGAGGDFTARQALFRVENRTTITSIGNGLRLYEAHLGKMIEVTDHFCQDREPDYIVYWHYEADKGRVYMGKFALSCQFAKETFQTFGTGNDEEITIHHRGNPFQENIATLVLDRNDSRQFASLVQTIEPQCIEFPPKICPGDRLF